MPRILVPLLLAIGGALLAPSAYFMKSPPEQYHDDIARDRLGEFIAGYRYAREESLTAAR